MNFIIVGAGALGSIYAAYLARGGHQVSLIARGERAAALARHGISIVGEDSFSVDCDIVTKPETLREADVVIVAIKTYDADEALALLDGLAHLGNDPDTILFPSPRGKPLSDAAMRKYVQVTLGKQGLTVHGFRSTFRDYVAERTGFPREVAEAALAHVVKCFSDPLNQTPPSPSTAIQDFESELKLTDLVGLDVRLSIAEYLAREIGAHFEPPALLREKVAKGELGKKSGQGFYNWKSE